MAKNKKDSGDVIVSMDEVIQTVLDNISKREGGRITGLPTGFENLDQMLNGLNKGDLIAIAGHPSIGCTALALGILENLSVDNGIPTLFFSMDNSKEKIVERMLLSRSRIEWIKASKGTLNDEEMALLNKTASEITGKPFLIDDTSRLTPDEIHDKAKKLKDTSDIQCVIVDYLQAMRLVNKSPVQEDDFAEIARRLKLLAKELNVPVILLVELCFDYIRKHEERTEPRIADLGKAVIIERYIDVLMLINRHDYYGFCAPDDTYTEIKVTKNKNGETGFVGLDFSQECARFRELFAKT